MAGALIVTAMLGARDLSRLDGLRREHFPPERNFLKAHLTLFHALPPSLEAEAKALLSQLAAHHRKPDAKLSEVMSLGRGVAFRIRSDDLEALRQLIAEHFHGALTAQDNQGWRPHITIQNKVESKVAKALKTELERSFEPRPLEIAGLALHRYMDGPWEPIGRWNFRGRGSAR
ncbi:2'-5' RNA ligase family protein [Sphingomicrobium clamense]|uniref:2'-5' RNA ligase family protein n=1 Tax=Sphingomicrobium clamense TaxID=2851013 RepID=A0ABS6V6P5_9SPHN|nr:2'-5' RNA ligase family protein [Sphingomicrobium sp. B8]MBW0145234.1 2'-5' RNA ligase family protein [Sphingomicrobium sp. B8]